MQWDRVRNAFCLKKNLSSLVHAPDGRQSFVDGLRAIAVFWVIALHVIVISGSIVPREQFVELIRRPGLRWMLHGHFGVDLFFVISGFLIGSLILKELKSTLDFQFWRFYSRRLLRLCPAYFLVVLGVWFVTSQSPGTHFHTGAYLAQFFYLQNFLPVAQQPLAWTWSLAVEEQFYLLCPLLLFAIWKWKWDFLRVLTALITLCLGIRFWILTHADPQIRLVLQPSLDPIAYSHLFDIFYDGIHTRSGALLCGVFVAAVHQLTSGVEILSRRPLWRAGLFGMSLIWVGFALGGESPHQWDEIPGLFYMTGFQTAFGAAAAIWILLALSNPQAKLIRVFSLPLWLPFAQLSYSAYLLHPIVIHLGFKNWYESHPITSRISTGDLLVLGGILFLSTFIAALILYLLVERPFMNLRENR